MTPTVAAMAERASLETVPAQPWWSGAVGGGVRGVRAFGVAVLAVGWVMGAGFVVPAARGAAPRFTYVGVGASVPRGDGNRYVGWDESRGSTLLLDLLRHRRRHVRVPTECHSTRDLFGDQAGLVAIGGGSGLWACPGTYVPRAFVLATGRLEPKFPPLEATGDLDCDRTVIWTGIGTAGLTGLCQGYHYDNLEVAWDRWTGHAIASFSQQPVANDRPVTLDVNHRGLVRTMCTPIFRRQNAIGYEPVIYRAPYALSPARTETYTAGLATALPLILQHCGTTTIRTLSRCHQTCEDAELGRSLATWINTQYGVITPKRNGVWVYSLKRRHAQFLRLPSPPLDAIPARGAVFAATAAPAGHTYRIYRARIN